MRNYDSPFESVHFDGIKMKQAINLTGKAAGVKKAAKSKARGSASAERRPLEAEQGQITSLQ